MDNSVLKKVQLMSVEAALKYLGNKDLINAAHILKEAFGIGDPELLDLIYGDSKGYHL